MPSDDLTLLSAVGRGDRDAWETIYNQHKDALLTSAVFLLAGDRSTAEDVLHDVFVSLVQCAAQIELRGTLRNYLLACCLNRARSTLRKKKERALESQIVPEPAGNISASDEDAAAYTVDELARALSRLPAEQREVVTLHIHGGQTFREIAELLELSINTAQSRYRYALSNLRKQLARHVAPGKA